jgi:hypothetical protein
MDAVFTDFVDPRLYCVLCLVACIRDSNSDMGIRAFIALWFLKCIAGLR